MKTQFKTYRFSYHITQHPGCMGSVCCSKGFTGPQVGISGKHTHKGEPTAKQRILFSCRQVSLELPSPKIQDSFRVSMDVRHLGELTAMEVPCIFLYRAKRDLAQMTFPAHIGL